MTQVVRIQRKNGIIVQDCDVYIGRACNQGGWRLPSSIWHNPFSIKQYGRRECLQLYKEYIIKKISEQPDIYDISSLRDKRLGCWCGNGRDIECHGNILIDILEER